LRTRSRSSGQSDRRADRSPDEGQRAAVRTAPIDRPAFVWTTGLGLIFLGGLLLAAPFLVVMTGERPPEISLAWDFSVGLGFGALSLVAVQFALTGRLRWLTHPYGADIVYLCHRYLSIGAVALMLGHFGIFYIWHQPALGELNPLTADWELTAGRVALFCFVALIVTSEFRKRLHLDYDWWRRLHLALAIVGFATAVAHVLGVGRFTAEPGQRALWLGVTVAWLLLLLWVRLGVPWMQARNPWRVVANREERGGVHTLELEPQGHALKNWKPGQFAWLSIGRSPFALKEHPFTISTAPDRGPNLSFSIKGLGDDTKRMIHTPVGAIAHVDGPYGAFSVDRTPDAGGFVMIAGGVGITPILSNLHALQERGDQRPVILIYANSKWDEVAFREELAEMQDDMNLTVVHVIEDPPEDWEGEDGYIDKDMLERHLPAESRDWPHLLCGPGPMTQAAIDGLHALGVSERHIDNEVFDLA